MDESKKNLRGSASRDLFKVNHKRLDPNLYALDIDFVLVDKYPFPGIVAIIDYKQSNDRITFSEVIAYNSLIQHGYPVYIVEGDAEIGMFDIYRYKGGNHIRPDYDLALIKSTNNWREYENWEMEIRSIRRAVFGERK